MHSLYWQGNLVNEPIVIDSIGMMSLRSVLMMDPKLSKMFTNSGFDVSSM